MSDQIPTTKIDVAETLAPVIGSRDIADTLKSAIKKAASETVDLDFAHVEFVSRSAAHELLTMKEEFMRKTFSSKQLSFVNANKDVEEMFRVVAANRAMPRTTRASFAPKKIDIESLSPERSI